MSIFPDFLNQILCACHMSMYTVTSIVCSVGDNGNSSAVSTDSSAFKALKEELEDLKEDNDTLCKNVSS